ncbi:MAG: hypothetical protein K6B75_03790 [Lachnospiraceae bacterium]|nr:hypothetical protein [Lachnospiraceae bacterium]
MPLLSIYNNLIQGYALSKQTRFDTHKQSELKDVYRRIMRMSSEQPFYKVNFDDNAQKYTLGVKDSSIAVSSALKELHINDESSVFRRKALVSSEPDSVEVVVSEGTSPEESFTDVEVAVSSLASPQVNKGNYVESQSSDLPSGQYNFVVEIDKNAYSFQFKVGEDASNISLQTKLTDFINKASIGLKAHLTQDRVSGESRIELKSANPGIQPDSEHAFTLSDTRLPDEAAKGIVDFFGLNNISEEARNTVFTVDGEEHTSRGSTYYLTKDVSVNIKSITMNAAHISVVTDKTPVVEEVESFFSKYNEAIAFIQENGGNTRGSRRLLHEMSRITNIHKQELANVGIKVSEKGKLESDKDIIYPAAENGSLEEFFASDTGFVHDMLHQLSGISLNPMDYLDKVVITYPNVSAAKTYSPYISSTYSGLLYNNYC